MAMLALPTVEDYVPGNTNMKPLEPPDSHHLSASMGWLGLGDWQEANKELDRIAPEFRRHPGVLLARHEIFSKGRQWNNADEVARELIQIHPEESQFWIWHAYAARRMTGGGIPQAREILDKARQLFNAEPLIPFNLACYECQLGNLQAAWKWLETAFKIGDAKAFKAMALEDRDLEPLWPRLREPGKTP
jgi:hypothetical protein